MRFVAWSNTFDWFIYFADVVSVERISTSKWRVTYREYPGYVVVIADHAWIGVL